MPDPIHIKDKLPQYGESIFSKMTALSNANDAINLAQGFPEEDAPKKLIEALQNATAKGFNQYAPMPGLPELQIAIAKKWEEEYEIQLKPLANIQVMAGATQAIFTALQALVGSGDEVIVFAPAYDSFIPGIQLAGAKAVAVPAFAPGFAPDWEAFEKALTPKTKAVIVNTPHNPSGRCFDENDWQKLIELTAEQELIIISDEVYEPLVFDGKKHLSVLHFPEIRYRSLAVFSFGKAFNITGWKLGYLAGSPQLLQLIRKVHQFQLFAVHTPSQKAIADFLNQGGNSFLLRDGYEEKRNYFSKAIQEIGFKPLECAASYFLLVDYSPISDISDVEFCEWLTREVKVSAVPVSVLYPNKKDQKLLRFCFAKKQETLEKAIEKLWTISK